MSDITKSYIENYLEAIRPKENEGLLDLEYEAKNLNIPIIKHDAKQTLKLLLHLHKPYHILEIGTAVAFSALTMADTLQGKCHITTIERDPRMVERATTNIKKFNRQSCITILEGDSETILPSLAGPYDLIFMDAAKGQYLTFLPYCLDLLKPGGLLVSDNVLQNGYIAKSKWSIPRRQRTIHTRMRQYLWTLNHNPLLQTAILPVSDGLTISIKKEYQ